MHSYTKFAAGKFAATLRSPYSGNYDDVRRVWNRFREWGVFRALLFFIIPMLDPACLKKD